MVGDGTASDGLYRGVAPGAGLVAFSVGEGANILDAVAAYDYLLAHPELGVVAINNSWGRSQSDGAGRHDSTDPVNVATKKLHAAGVASVFSAGNTSTGDGENGESTCDREGTGTCRFSIYGSAPWAIAVAAGRKDEQGGPGDQHLGTFSSRGDPRPQVSLDGKPVRYVPTLTAPGVNVRAARTPGVASLAACASAEPSACTEPPAAQYEALYVPMSGTSMAAPHVTAAIAVIQSAVKQRGKKPLSPDQVRDVLVKSAAPMTGEDGWWDWPCGEPYGWTCGDAEVSNFSGARYEEWQVGAGYLDVRAALTRVTTGPPR
jgi:serine protease AprX